MQFKAKLSNADFENKLMNLVEAKSGQDPTKLVYKGKHNEDGKVIWLYYWKTRTDEKPFDTHIGTWQKGEGWIYKFNSKGVTTYGKD